MLKYKENLPDDNPFENFDAGYQAVSSRDAPSPWHRPEGPPRGQRDSADYAHPHLQPPYTTGLADQNVFEKEGDDDKAKPYKENVAEESVLDDMPDDYPFNELKGGHTWHEWKGESVMEALGESNALDDGTTKSESYELGEHSLGRPFKEVRPESPPRLSARFSTSPHHTTKPRAILFLPADLCASL